MTTKTLEDLGITLTADAGSTGAWWLTSPDKQGEIACGDSTLEDAMIGVREAVSQSHGDDWSGWTLDCVVSAD
jgi:hypothetical protein